MASGVNETIPAQLALVPKQYHKAKNKLANAHFTRLCELLKIIQTLGLRDLSGCFKMYPIDWTGENKQIKKRGFATKREALDYERNYKIRQENNLDMTFGEFWKLYSENVKNYVKLNT